VGVARGVTGALGVLGERACVGVGNSLSGNTGRVLADGVESINRVINLEINAIVQVTVNSLHDDLNGSLLAVLEIAKRQTRHAEVSSTKLVNGAVKHLTEVLLAIRSRLGTTVVTKTESVLSDGGGVRGLE
jgi:hypothetical protein